MLLLNSCSQYQFVRAKPAKTKIETTKENKAKDKHIEQTVLLEDVSDDIRLTVPPNSNELLEEHLFNEELNDDLGNDIIYEETIAKEYAFEQLIESQEFVADTPTVNSNTIVPKPLNNEWRDKAALWGFFLTLLWIIGGIVLAVATLLALGGGGGGIAAAAIVIAAVVFFLAFLAGLVLSIIGLQSENYQVLAIIALVIYGLMILPGLIGSLAN